MNLNKFLVPILCILVAGSWCLSAYVLVNKKEVGYVDVIRLFGEYEMKKELEKKDEPQLKAIQYDVDSLKTVYEMMVKKDGVDKQLLRSIESQIQYMAGVFEGEYSRSNSTINEKVWKRLNPLVDEFAKKEKLDLLVGANGMGTVLYGSKQTDYTDKLIKFVNDKYAVGQ